MNTILKILNKQLELNDCIDSYSYSSKIKDEIYEDEKGRYKIKEIIEEVPCKCHPETCTHFRGKEIKIYKEKKYLK